MSPELAMRLRRNVAVVLEETAKWWNEQEEFRCKLSVDLIGDRKLIIQQTHPKIDLIDLCKTTVRKLYQKTGVLGGFVKSEGQWSSKIAISGESSVGEFLIRTTTGVSGEPYADTKSDKPMAVVIYIT